jgi:hypothetical protein
VEFPHTVSTTTTIITTTTAAAAITYAFLNALLTPA